jgi:hypothetical protein
MFVDVPPHVYPAGHTSQACLVVVVPPLVKEVATQVLHTSAPPRLYWLSAKEKMHHVM